jgi:DNA-binding response OmpR family regulator
MPEAKRTSPGVLRFGDSEVDLNAALLHKRGMRIRLREQSFQVLASLLEHPGGRGVGGRIPLQIVADNRRTWTGAQGGADRIQAPRQLFGGL